MRKMVTVLALGGFAAAIVWGVLLVIPLLGIPGSSRIVPISSPASIEIPSTDRIALLDDAGSPPPSEDTTTSRITLEEGWQTIPKGFGSAGLHHDPSEPLNRDLVFVESLPVRVPQGWLRVRTGVRAKLVEDRGSRVAVRIDKTTVEVPRKVLANIYAAQKPAERSTILAGVTQVFGKLFQPLPNSLGIDVKEIGTGRGIDRQSFERDLYRTKALAVEVRNVSRQAAGDCQAEVYWFGRKMKDRKLVIHHAEIIPLKVGPITSVTRRFWCPLAAASERGYYPEDPRDLAGSKLDGWLVVISRDGQVLARRGSGPVQSSIGESPDELKALLASYKPSGRSATESMPNWRKDPVRDEWRANTGKYYE